MERCKTCLGYYGEPKPVAVGEKCCFTLTTTRNGFSFNSRSVTGKLIQVNDDGGYSIAYRKKIYHALNIAHPDDPSPLTLAFCGSCNCSLK
ncbi:hypothetical protein [Xenorhabdus poinarii]|uniref:hypothetical protein n=1 Tax=Xenorhabdus poinarii TaxID=40577 RepID=UPI00138DFD2C|nr:hypothetical protein [Xenorhabdus poinarii]